MEVSVDTFKQFVKGIPFGFGAALGYVLGEALIRWAVS